MASNISRPLARSARAHTRMLSTAPAAKEAVVDREQRAYVKKLDNGLVVGTVETPSPVSRLAIVANAGARFENGKNLGISHLLRHALTRRTENFTGFRMCRTAQQLGGDISVEGSRENVFIKSSVTRNCAGQMVEIFKEMCTKQVFRPWEIEDIQADEDTLKLDLGILKTQPHICAIELLHAAAFREATLGRSIYAPGHMIGKMNREMLKEYVESSFGAGRLALVGVGIDREELEALGAEFKLYDQPALPRSSAVYYGGELRNNTGGDMSYVAVAFNGPSTGSQDLLPSEVLKCVLGTGPHIKYSMGATSALAAAANAASSVPHSVSSFSANYSDAGLFGFNVASHNSEVDKVVGAAVGQFQAVLRDVSEADVQRAKTQLKAAICMELENPDALLTWQGEQALNSDQILSTVEVCKMVDAITLAQVKNAAKKIAASKPSMAVTGNSDKVPYLDQLFK